MGVRISPFGASWAYGGFATFREALAAEESIVLSDMKGFGGEREWETSNGQHITPLTPLLNHSDCDGYLEPYECEEVVDRLSVILARWAARADGDPGRQYDVEHGTLLVAAMRHSVEHGCAVRFS